MLPRLFLLIALFAPFASPAGREVTVAAAANLTEVFGEIGPAFESATGIHPVFSFASTAQLAAQIGHAAPFDVFCAADSSHVEDLDRRGLLAPGSRAIYAVGVLALWIPPGRRPIARIEDLASPQTRVIALARPELAPYGQAAVEALRHARVWDKVRSKIVYAANISMARQYGTSGNADAVFTAYSLLLKSGGTVIPLRAGYAPITQSLGVVASSRNQQAARLFVDFLLRGAGKQILLQSGYSNVSYELH